ncbi:MAG TPA: hypothetical protein VKF36_01870 [Syntrophorhabdales bacterium]|nr:hypothetical protein [Syntrophorhabdales bacterium]
MAGKIFYRERTKSVEGKQQPRFRIVAVADVNLKIFGEHVRKSELEAIAKAVGAELVLLPPGDKKRKGNKDVTLDQ